MEEGKICNFRFSSLLLIARGRCRKNVNECRKCIKLLFVEYYTDLNRKCRYCYQKVNGTFGENYLKINRLVKRVWVLEIVIPKTIDKTVFIGYNVDIIFVLQFERISNE